jgi:hypothetical protein
MEFERHCRTSYCQNVELPILLGGEDSYCLPEAKLPRMAIAVPKVLSTRPCLKKAKCPGKDQLVTEMFWELPIRFI